MTNIYIRIYIYVYIHIYTYIYGYIYGLTWVTYIYRLMKFLTCDTFHWYDMWYYWYIIKIYIASAHLFEISNRPIVSQLRQVIPLWHMWHETYFIPHINHFIYIKTITYMFTYMSLRQSHIFTLVRDKSQLFHTTYQSLVHIYVTDRITYIHVYVTNVTRITSLVSYIYGITCRISEIYFMSHVWYNWYMFSWFLSHMWYNWYMISFSWLHVTYVI